MRLPRYSPILLILFVLLVFLPAGIWIFRTPLLNRVFLPVIERTASERLEAPVRIGRIELEAGALLFTDLTVEKDGVYILCLPRAEARWTLAGLLARRLAALELDAPELTVWGGEGGGWTPSGHPPVAIDHLEVRQGKFDYRLPERDVLLREVSLRTSLGPPAPIHFSARIGSGDLMVTAKGEGEWRDGLGLSLKTFRWDGRELLAEPLVLALRPAGGAALGASVEVDRFSSRELETALAAFEISSPLSEGWEFALVRPSLEVRLEDDLLELHLRISGGTLTRDGLSVPFQDVRLQIRQEEGVWKGKGGFVLAGTASARLEAAWKSGTLDGRLEADPFDPGALKMALLGGSRPPLKGQIAAGARFRVDGEGASIQVRLDGERGGPASEKGAIELSPLGLWLTGDRRNGTWKGKGEISLEQRKVATFSLSGDGLDFRLLPLSARDLRALAPEALPEAVTTVEGLSGKGTLGWHEPGPWRGTLDLKGRKILLGDEVLEDLTLSGTFSGGPRTEISRFKASGRLSGEGLTGRFSLDGKGFLGKEQFDLRLDSLEVQGLDYLSSDGTAGLGGGSLRGRGTVSGRSAEEIDLDLSAQISAREVLKGSFYAELSGLKGEVGLRGRFHVPGKRLEAERLSLKVDESVSLTLQGLLVPGKMDLKWVLAMEDLRRPFSGPLRNVLAGIGSPAEGLRAGGALRGEGAFHRTPDRWRLEGELKPEEIHLAAPDADLELEGLSGTFPLLLASADSRRENTGEGTLTLKRLKLSAVALSSATLHLEAASNRLSVRNPLLAGVAGGYLEMAGLRGGWGGEGAQFAAALRIREVDLERLTADLGWPSMRGRITADLGAIRYAGKVLRSEGTAGINAFGGSFLVRNMRFENPFSAYSTFHSDIDFSGIDLYQLTRTLEFGTIHGIADGHIHRLRLFGTVPSRFEALLETRERGKRDISVKALRNITRISQGGGASSILSRGLYRFIDFYRYRKIGIRCSLENDVFTLEGTARQGTDQILVDGGFLPPKINIVAPQHTISFKEMLRRIARIDRTGGGEAEGN